jgi:RNA polymerase sigma factor (sigma-70 family)
MRHLKHSSDEALLAAIVAGDERAFEVFYRRYLAAVTGFHFRRTGRRELAFDLTAETFATVVVACGDFDSDRGAAAGWLFGIAANKLRESLRRGRVEAAARTKLAHDPVIVDDEALERVEALASTAGEERIAGLLSELPTDQRDAILARVVDEQPYSEIAAAMSCSEALVRQRVHRGLRRLRNSLKEPV